MARNIYNKLNQSDNFIFSISTCHNVIKRLQFKVKHYLKNVIQSLCYTQHTKPRNMNWSDLEISHIFPLYQFVTLQGHILDWHADPLTTLVKDYILLKVMQYCNMFCCLSSLVKAPKLVNYNVISRGRGN